MKIRKAIIPAAGFGTRFFPITKSIQKEMLPILNKPIIDYLIDDCIKAGIEEIIIIVNENNDQIRKYYSEDEKLINYLKKQNKFEKYAKVSDLHTKARFTFITQSSTDPYGTAVPLILAKDYVTDEEAFLVLMGDDFFYNSDGSSEVSNMIDVFNKSNSVGLVTCKNVAHDEVSKYGIATYREQNGFKYLINQIEKPRPEEINSTYVTLSKYIFTPKIFQFFEGQVPDQRSGELYLTTTYTALAQQENVVIYEPKGEYIDSGDVYNWLAANLLIAKSDPLLWNKLIDFMKKQT
jgi:UTP--glucose-1-phosphate uridylyltransferase